MTTQTFRQNDILCAVSIGIEFEKYNLITFFLSYQLASNEMQEHYSYDWGRTNLKKLKSKHGY